MKRINWKVTLFSLFFLGVFLRLGFWQVDRADEKDVLIAAQRNAAALPPSSLDSIAEADPVIDGERVAGYGSYDDDIYLLDNRILEGKVGFEVLVPFFDDASETWFLVNRGFVPMGRTRQDAPVIPPMAKGPQRLSGRVYIGERADPGRADLVSEAAFGTIVQMADPALVSERRAAAFKPHYPYLIRLEESDRNALPRYWPASVMSPAKHRGYAAQWFTMAIAVSIAWLAFTFRRKPTEHE